MDLQVQEMISQQILVPNPFSTGFLSTIFLVQRPDGSSRPIINLKRLNQFLSPRKFHLLNHFKVPDFLQKNDFLVKIDLSQAYFHVPIKTSHQRFLSVSYRSQLFCMTCLPFGLATAPQIFAKLSNWVAGYLRKQGIRVIVYLDDFLLANQDPSLLQSQTDFTLEKLRFLGWSVNVNKSELTPVQALQYLGIVWNPSTDLKYLPLEKQNVIGGHLTKVAHSGKWSWKTAMVTMGFLSFASFVVPLGKLHYRHVQRQSRRLPRNHPLKLHQIPSLALSQLRWWISALHLPSPIFPRPPQAFVTTDASESGWGATVDNRMVKGLWINHQNEWHINVKELIAVQMSLDSNLDYLQNKVVLI
uniref:Polyprotein P3 n=1 Tax=Cacopsylla melanoneura TaxID=428564 RepID=A0A8D8VLQ8_9HEMI